VNSDEELMLLPYLTANLQFIVGQRESALLAPNAALRYKPQPAQVAPEYREEYEQQAQKHKGPPAGEGKGDPGAKADGGDKGDRPRHNQGTVWVEDNGYLRPVKVATGLTDNIQTEVIPEHEEDLPEGTAVVTGENREGPAGATNPFAPKFNNQQQKKKEQ
jgi:HlyD family secretion protein